MHRILILSPIRSGSKRLNALFPSYISYDPERIYRPIFSPSDKWYEVNQALSPHGGALVERIVENKDRAASMVHGLQSIELTDQQAREVFNIAYGVFSPLEGFMCNEDLDSVCRHMCLSNGYIWPIPILLDVSAKTLNSLGFGEGDDICLKHQGHPFAVLHVREIFDFSKKEIARYVYGTDDPDHPGVAKVLMSKDLFVGGKLDLVNPPKINSPFDKFWFSPRKMREEFRRRGYETAIFHQTRNVPHLGHEFIMKAGSFYADGIVVSAVIGEKKPGDYIDEIIVLAHDTLSTEGYIRRDRHLVTILFWDMRYAGPREAVFHGLIRKNLGGTHHMYGRDHAGVGNYYHKYAAHAIFHYLPDLGFKPQLILEYFYCPLCDEIAYEGLCGHKKHWQSFSGTEIRSIINEGITPPKRLLRPEVFRVIMDGKKKYGQIFVTEDYLRNRIPPWTVTPLQTS
jgi:sulfate adenylyltransferase